MIFEVFSQTLYNTQQKIFDISHLRAGLYFIQIKTEKGITVRKVIKQ
jgi:hypothetical protein